MSGDDVRRLPLRVDLRQRLRQQAVARHHEEDAGLAEQQDQDDRRQRDEGGIAEQVADRAVADLCAARGPAARASRPGHLGILRAWRTGARALPSRSGSGTPSGAHDRLAADRADRAGRDQHVEDGADGEASRSGRSARCAAGSWSPRPRSRPRRSRHKRRRWSPPRRPTPTPEPKPPNRPAGSERVRNWPRRMTGRVRTMNAVSAVTLIATRTALNSRALRGADHQQPGHQQGDDDGRQVDEARPRRRRAPAARALSQSGKSIPQIRSITVSDEIVRTSRPRRRRRRPHIRARSAQPTVQARNSPITA